jgi:antitoxin MazE
VKTHLIQIGNSKGVRLPKPLLKQSGLQDEIELEVREGQITLRPVKAPRSDWEDAFEEMAAHRKDQLLDPEFPTKWDKTEWEW